jgi:hypothetical protein
MIFYGIVAENCNAPLVARTPDLVKSPGWKPHSSFSLFPTIQLPWTSIASVKPFEAPGWVEPIGTSETAIQIQAEYDHGFRGEFIELETTAPKTCIRLPMYAIEDARSYLRLS